MTLEEQLNQINEAITAIEIGGQEYQLGNQRLRRADLSTLYKQRRELQMQLSYENRQYSTLANTYAAVFDRR